MDLLERLNETQIPTALISTVSLMFLSFSRKILDPWLSNVFEFPVPYELLVVSHRSYFFVIFRLSLELQQQTMQTCPIDIMSVSWGIYLQSK